MAPISAVVTINIARSYNITHTGPYKAAGEAAEAALIPLPDAVNGPGSGASPLAASYVKY
jgi:hypothetical protein